MKLIICGTGRITDELLKRMGESWEITLIEKQESRLSPFAQRFPNIVRVMAEDASSPVVLEKAGLADQDAVLAMTNDDDVNLAIARFARGADIKTVVAVVRDPEKIPEFQELNIWTISITTDAARKVYQFLKDPRIRIIGLGEGEGELLEMVVGRKDVSSLANIASWQDPEWQVAGIIRKNSLLFPDTLISVKEGDRLLILGKAELYNTFSRRLAENPLHFPRTYGQHMILGVSDDASLDITELLNEAFYLAQGTHIEKIKITCETPIPDIEEAVSRWSESLEIEMVDGEGSLKKRTTKLANEIEAGIVIIPHTQRSFPGTLMENPLIKLAASLPCPLLLSRFTDPYERLLVPFNRSLASQRALEIAMDLAAQLTAEVSVIIVVEPAYLRGDAAASGQWEQETLKQVRELSRVHKIEVQEIICKGNPVKEIAAAAIDFQLLVMGRQNGDTGFFSTGVPGMVVDRTPCSILLVS